MNIANTATCEIGVYHFRCGLVIVEVYINEVGEPS